MSGCFASPEPSVCREFATVLEPDARLGLVAVQLGEPEEAKKLFISAGRSDLLNKLLQARPAMRYVSFSTYWSV